MGPCHHGITLSQVVVGEDGFQIWKVTANVLNKQSWTVDEWWSSSLVLGEELITLHCKRPAYYDMLRRALNLRGLLGMTCTNEICMRFGIWNVRSLYEACSLKAIASKSAKLHLMAEQVVRWTVAVVNPQMIAHFFYKNRNADHHLGTDYFIYKGMIWTVKTVELLVVGCCI
jgi:hypothetical protein